MVEEKKQSEKPKINKKVDRSVLSFFILLFPSLIISLSSSIGIKAGLLIYQAILLKQFIEDYYKN